MKSRLGSLEQALNSRMLSAKTLRKWHPVGSAGHDQTWFAARTDLYTPLWWLLILHNGGVRVPILFLLGLDVLLLTVILLEEALQSVFNGNGTHEGCRWNLLRCNPVLTV